MRVRLAVLAVGVLSCGELLGNTDGSDEVPPPDAGPTAGEAADADVYASPAGDDGNDGSRERPVRTIGKALASAQALLETKPTARVALCVGDYEVAPFVIPGGIELRGRYDCSSWLRPVSPDGEPGVSFEGRVSRIRTRAPSLLLVEMVATAGRAPPLLDAVAVEATDIATPIGILGSATLTEVAVSSFVTAATFDLFPAGGIASATAIAVKDGTGVTRIEHCSIVFNSVLPAPTEGAVYPRAGAGIGVYALDSTLVARRNVVTVSSVLGTCNGVLTSRSDAELTENEIATLSCVAALPDSGVAAVGQAHAGSTVRSLRNSMYIEGPGRLDRTQRSRVFGIRTAPFQNVVGVLTSDGDRVVGPDLLHPDFSSALFFQGFAGESVGRITNASILLNASLYPLTQADGINLTAPRDQVVAHNTVHFVGLGASADGVQ